MATLAMQCIAPGDDDERDSVLCQVRAIMCGCKHVRARDKREHWHQCGARAPLPRKRDGDPYYPGWDRSAGCGAIWSHRAIDIDDDSPDNAHECPRCGKLNLWAWNLHEMQKRNRGKSFDARYTHGKGIRHINEFCNTTAAIFPVPSDDGHG